MEILTAAHTDIGIQKSTNQDSLCIKMAETSVGKVVLAVICDGMGGLSKGEVASATVIHAFSKWFDQELPTQLAKDQWSTIQNRWEQIIQEQNERIGAHGRAIRSNLGTTLTAMLLIDSKFMLVGHVGDSRVYRLDSELRQLTEDQTVVARDIKQGRITPEQAKTDPRRNVLLQCIGASNQVRPEFFEGRASAGEVYLLCSDGFRHKISEEEIYSTFAPANLSTEDEMETRAVRMVELVKERQETDNISVVIVKIQ
ncbi:PP2C family protein-serine/threonine phosphatase [Ornithinibacillus halotolerans]|uniref:Serine/threonine protein phosphatase n=1 Tax=Ornithinibacillus halotolerans TaxID=1274357 RepID=A0A916S200_9BACI|nr:protein phosphatase 2C domain-containing protein [Ornithinibacillus halotolerans]GGA79671.1 serine/threonine protein phosphatase [Ornithinibacillus halotolerans]